MPDPNRRGQRKFANLTFANNKYKETHYAKLFRGLRGAPPSLERHLYRYLPLFRSSTQDLSRFASRFVSGLIQGRKRNIERICEAVPDTNYDSMHNFLSVSPWQDQPIRDAHMRDVDRELGGSDESCLIIDDSAFLKKGVHSVGVARQWAGVIGKVDNCQVGVFSALSRGRFSQLLDTRLFFPRAWVGDSERLAQANVPAEHRKYLPKWKLALELIKAADSAGVRYGWVVVDGGYGHQRVFLRKLDEMGKTYLAEVHKNQRIYAQEPIRKTLYPDHPDPYIRRLSGIPKPITVGEWEAAQPESDWKSLTVRDSTKGKLHVQVLHRHVWVFSGQRDKYLKRHLLVRRDLDKAGRVTRTKYCLSNASEETTALVLVQRQASRFWVENCFREGKQELGLKEYQVRKWRAWQHHMTMVLLLGGWMLRMRCKYKNTIPYLSVADLRLVTASLLPSKEDAFDILLAHMLQRHLQRGWDPPDP